MSLAALLLATQLLADPASAATSAVSAPFTADLRNRTAASSRASTATVLNLRNTSSASTRASTAFTCELRNATAASLGRSGAFLVDLPGTPRTSVASSDAFTIDLRCDRNAAVLHALDSTRSPTALLVRPGDVFELYFSLTDPSGCPFESGDVSYELGFVGIAPSPGAATWGAVADGVVGLEIKADLLNLEPGQKGTITFPLVGGTLTVDGETVTLEGVPPDLAIERTQRTFRDEWDVYAALSAGATGCLGVCGEAGAVGVSLAAARLSVKGKGGGGLRLILDADDSLRFERRVAVSGGASLKVPSVEAKAGPYGRLAFSGLAVGLEAGHTTTQVFRYAGSGTVTSEQARLFNAACFLETASPIGLLTSPYLGPILKAVIDTTLFFSDAPALLKAGRMEERHATTVGGEIAVGSAAISPGIVAGNGVSGKGIGLSVSVAALQGGATGENAVLYSSSGDGTPVTRRNKDTVAWVAAGGGPLAVASFIDPGILGCNAMSVDASRYVSLDALTGAVQEAGLAFGAQAGTDVDLGIFRTQDFDGGQVVLRVPDAALATKVVMDPQTALAPLASLSAGSMPLGRQASADTFGWTIRRARDLADPRATALAGTVDRVSGRVQTLAPSVRIQVPNFPLGFDIGLQLEHEQRRVLAGARRTALLHDSAADLGHNDTPVDWRDADSLWQVLQDRVFNGIGPLIQNAIGNLFGFFDGVLGSTMQPVTGTLDVQVTDPVTGRVAGAVHFDPSYAGMQAIVVTADPSRPELRSQVAGPAGFAEGARWGYATSRVVASAPPGARADASTLVLIGNTVHVVVKDAEGHELSPLAAPVTLELPLYADQVARMGGDTGRLLSTGIFRHQEGTDSWAQVPATIAADAGLVSAPLTVPGLYAPGLLSTAAPGDSDHDGLPDASEDLNGNATVDQSETDPFNWDTDGDGVGDGAEVAAGTDPLDPHSAPNRAPVLGRVGNRTITAGLGWTLHLQAFDPDDDPLEFGAEDLPAGASVSPESGVVTWERPRTGTYNIVFSVRDVPPMGRSLPLVSSEAVLLEVTGVPGDANGDGRASVDDVFYLINYLFAGGPMPVGPADANNSGNIEVGDVFYLINFLFAGGPEPTQV